MAARSRTQVCNTLNLGIAGSNLSEGMEFLCLVFVVCCVGSDFCYWLTPRAEESPTCSVCV
jgi:hypothetical protein